MTRRQHQLLRFIESHIADRGYSPSFEEMREALGCASKASVARLVNKLKSIGAIVEDRRGGKRNLIPAKILDLSEVSTARLVAELEDRGIILGSRV